MRLRWVAGLSLVFTYLFFFEYLPPFRWVDIPHDLQYYHYPLDDFAFQNLSSGHFPEWDQDVYCGMSFVGNSQTALFYPPMWLVFLENYGQPRLKYRSLEVLVLGHVWLAFVFCFLWLRNLRLRTLACVLGAGIFAYSGYLVEQLEHLGLVCGYAWFPIGLLGIDQAVESGQWRRLWKLVLASAFCFLAGYPPMWLVFCVCMLTYAVFRPAGWRAGVWTGTALMLSLGIAMAQLLPAAEAAGYKRMHESYGAGIRDAAFYLSYFVPNYYDFRLTTPGFTNLGFEYLYLGAPAFFGLFWLAGGRKALRAARPVLAVGLAALIMVTNSFGAIWGTIRHWDLLAQVCRSYYFLSGITLSIAALSAIGLDRFLRRPIRRLPGWLTPLTILALGLWPARLLWVWRPGSPGFSTGWHSAMEPAVMLAIFGVAMFVLVSESGRRRIWVTAAVLAAVGVDYKVFGTSLRFNAASENVDRMFASAPLPGLRNAVYRKLREDPSARVALDSTDPVPSDLRHYGLATPQGGDPLVPAQYHKVLPPVGDVFGFLAIDSSDRDLLQLLGVRFFLTAEGQAQYARLMSNSDFRLLQPADSYFKAFEFLKARPPYRWEVPGAGDRIQRTRWTAEERDFEVLSERGGRFILIEQWYPGWQASVDGKPVSIERWHDAFQRIFVPAGGHQVRFKFQSHTLRVGAAISAASLSALIVIAVPRRRRP